MPSSVRTNVCMYMYISTLYYVIDTTSSVGLLRQVSCVTYQLRGLKVGLHAGFSPNNSSSPNRLTLSQLVVSQAQILNIVKVIKVKPVVCKVDRSLLCAHLYNVP